MSRPLRICLVANARHPIAEPFAGGLESFTHGLARRLLDRGHAVAVFAAPGSDPRLGLQPLPVAVCSLSERALGDQHAPPRAWMEEHHAYLDLMLDLGRTGAARFDLVHNNSLHHLPVAMASAVDVPVLTTLHTPPVPWLESAIELGGGGSFVAVSEHTRTAWRHVVDSTVVLNGVDTQAWRAGPGGGPAVWTGRLVREKAPHLAIQACRRAGVPLVLAGPVGDHDYVEREVRPLLGGTIRYVGHLDAERLVELVGGATVALVTPAWDEPYGLVAAEALSCGTPVAGFARGALPEVVPPGVGVLVPSQDVDALARAVVEAATLDRGAARRHAERTGSLDRMVDDYERVYQHLVRPGIAA